MSVTSYQKFNKGELTQLLDIAREAIRGHLSTGVIKTPQLDLYHKKLLAPAACFVTLAKLPGACPEPGSAHRR